MHSKVYFSYTGKYDFGNHSLFASFQPLHPAEKYYCGIISRPSKRLQLFSELKAGPDGKTDMLGGFRARFQEGLVTGSIASSGKATSVYKRFVEMFEVTLTTQMDFSKPS